MRRGSLLATLLMACTFESGQALALADVKAENAVQLSPAALRELMPGAQVVLRTPSGATRRWQNKADGTFVASTDGRGGGGPGGYATGAGTWRVSDEGKLCVKIQWSRPTIGPEDWCRFIFKAGDKYYGVARYDDSAVASEFEFSK